MQVQSFKFVPLVYQIASRMGSCKESTGSHSFQVYISMRISSEAYLSTDICFISIKLTLEGLKLESSCHSCESFLGCVCVLGWGGGCAGVNIFTDVQTVTSTIWLLKSNKHNSQAVIIVLPTFSNIF